MPQNEGVIKFDLQYEPGPPPAAEVLRELNAWRRILWLLGLTGQDPARYDGFAYGNVSARLGPGEQAGERRPFVISGTQTGGLPELGRQHYALVTSCNPARNRVTAEGPIRPSSEALTHGALYALDARLGCVLHVHSPLLWQRAVALGLPVTSPTAAYGTRAMAEEVARLYADMEVRRNGVIAMGGHEDGLVSFGSSVQRAGTVMVQTLARALADRGILD
jgi:hypothetical protein